MCLNWVRLQLFLKIMKVTNPIPVITEQRIRINIEYIPKSPPAKFKLLTDQSVH